MFKYHYLRPEKLWGVFDANGYCVALFATPEEASSYCTRHNGG